MSWHKTCYVISYHGILCHDMSYVTTITAILLPSWVRVTSDCYLLGILLNHINLCFHYDFTTSEIIKIAWLPYRRIIPLTNESVSAYLYELSSNTNIKQLWAAKCRSSGNHTTVHLSLQPQHTTWQLPN